MKKTKTVYSDLAMARESDSITCILVETQRQAEEWENFRCALIRCRWHGKAVYKLSKKRIGYWVSLVSSEIEEVGTKIRGAISY
jgi:hypothetical protein